MKYKCRLPLWHQRSASRSRRKFLTRERGTRTSHLWPRSVLGVGAASSPNSNSNTPLPSHNKQLYSVQFKTFTICWTFRNSMKSTFGSILLALLVGVAVAFIRPAHPFQVENPSPSGIVSFKTIVDELDNSDIAADDKIHPARKCKESDARPWIFFVCCVCLTYDFSICIWFLV